MLYIEKQCIIKCIIPVEQGGDVDGRKREVKN